MKNKRKRKVKAHKRFDPRINKKVNVDSYDRNQNIKPYKKISKEQEGYKRFKNFATKTEVIDYIEGLMGSKGNRKEAIALTNLLLEERYFQLNYDGYWSIRKLTNFQDLWEKSRKQMGIDTICMGCGKTYSKKDDNLAWSYCPKCTRDRVFLYDQPKRKPSNEQERKKKIEELDKQLAQHWKDTEQERKRTHSGKMYEQYLKK